MLRQGRSAPAKYNSAPQRPTRLRRQGVEPLLKRNDVNTSNNTQRPKKEFSKPDIDIQASVSSDVDREPEEPSSEESSEDEDKGAGSNIPSIDAIQVRKYIEKIASATTTKRKLEDDADERISSWKQQSTHRKAPSKNRYRGYNNAKISSDVTGKTQTKPVVFKNIHAVEDAGPSKTETNAGKKRSLRVPSAPELLSESAPTKASSKFNRPESLLPSSHPSMPDEAEDLENEDPDGQSTKKAKRQFNTPEILRDLAANRDLQNPACGIKVKRMMKLPRTSENTALLQSPVLANEVLEGSTGSSRSRAHSIGSSNSSMSDVEEIDNPDPDVIVEKVQCPICSERLIKKLWDEWVDKHPRMSLKDKQEFCAQHTMRNARETWSTRGYPELQWGEAFKQRLEGYRAFLDDLLQNPGQSFFRAQLQGAVDRGESRTIQKRGAEVHKSNVGYYGLRGLEHISAFISYEFAAELRAIAITDAVIAARDQSGYINMVLVPELVSRLIMDDMDVDVERAREIMDESHALGDLLCGEESSTQRS